MEIKDIKIKFEGGYPEPENVVEDKQAVAVLKNLLSSNRGEIAGVLQYVFQSSVADKTNQEIGKLFEEIAVVEMMHTELLMHDINSFGGVAKFEDSYGNIFTGNYINYSLKLTEMLEHNIKAEQHAIEDYELAIKMVKNESLKQQFQRIIEDEKLHLNAFKIVRDTVQFMSI
ncbi:MAG: manganese catalase family protein [Clostridia bacterium]|nr:manganese catalase family protein [Clostridia bacterium]